MRRTQLWLFALVLALLAPPVHAQMLPDSTRIEHWRLANGLEVRTRHVPRAPGIAVTLAVRAGRGYDPAGVEGLADLLAELTWTAPAGSFPARTREDLTSVRPLGAETNLTGSLARFTEIAAPTQLPGVLAELAARMGGVTVTDATLKSAVTQVRRDAGARYFGPLAEVLYWRAGAIARGADDAALLRLAQLPGLSKVNARDAAARLHEWYAPGSASLALAGDLSGQDVRALVEATFGRLAAAPGLPDTVAARLSGHRRTMTWKDLTVPAGVIAVEAPPLTDSLHAGFYLGLAITGASITKSWGAAGPPLVSRFQYSLYDDPELMRFYPPVAAEATDPDLLAGALYEQLQVVGGQMVMLPIMDRVRYSLAWLLGAPMPPEIVQRMRAEPAGLGTLTSGMATRAVWHGDAFWAGYLERFMTLKLGHSSYYEYLADAAHQTTLLLTP